MDRLQKILARAGVSSRRAAEDLLRAGRVRVNGEVATLGQSADGDRDLIELDGKRVRLPRAWTYVILYKPEGVVTTASDEYDRRNVVDLIKGMETRIYPVGRLDLDAEGLLLLTNDGDMTTALTHPAGEVPKTYRVKARGLIAEPSLDQLRQGIELEDGPAKATFVHRITHRGPHQSGDNSWIELTVTEGRNHLVKRMFEAIGHPVIRLRRITFANLDLEGLRPGEWRNLRRDELHKLKAIARTAARKRASQQDPGRPPRARRSYRDDVGDRPQRADRPQRSDRAPAQREDRPQRGPAQRDDRAPRADRGPAQRDDRAPRSDRGPAPRDDRGPRSAPPRDDRAPRSDRGPGGRGPADRGPADGRPDARRGGPRRSGPRR
ncbi:MAG: pseudouridine synthase [Myxococcales bacterium]|nr:pseudouridine synthase [Myxococcales bacterium]